MKRKILVSVDDGSVLDLRLSGLFKKYKIPAVFYIAPNYSDLLDEEIKEISTLFEIGAHTMNHPPDLKRLDKKQLDSEVFGSKAYLEDVIKKPVTKFCYPRGRHNQQVKDTVKLAGFKEARTTIVLSTDFPKDPFETNTSIHVHPNRKEYKDSNWVELGYKLFDKVIKEGGRFEMWMHSWEIEKYNLWMFVDDFLWYMDDEMKKINYKRKI